MYVSYSYPFWSFGDTCFFTVLRGSVTQTLVMRPPFGTRKRDQIDTTTAQYTYFEVPVLRTYFVYIMPVHGNSIRQLTCHLHLPLLGPPPPLPDYPPRAVLHTRHHLQPPRAPTKQKKADLSSGSCWAWSRCSCGFCTTSLGPCLRGAPWWDTSPTGWPSSSSLSLWIP